jgi:long-chain acyl-CoA synthetase
MATSSATATRPGGTPPEAPVDAQTIPALFQRTVATYPGKPGLRTIGGSVELTWSQVGARVRSLTESFSALGCKKGDRVAVLMRNLVDNHLANYALSHLGIVPFGIFNSSAVNQIVYQVGHAEAEVVITESRFLAKVAEAASQLGGQVRHIVVVDPDDEKPELAGNQISLAHVGSLSNPGFDFDAAWQSVEPEDIDCIIYTSGSTGPPKAAMCSHRMMTSAVRSIGAAIPLPRRALLSFLPMAHQGGRNNGHHYSLAYGATITVCPDMNDVPAALIDVHPDMFSSTPRIFEKLQVAIEGLIQQEPPESRDALLEALDRGLRFSRAEEAGSTATVAELETLRPYRAQDVELFKPILEKVGLDQLNVVIIGGATVNPDLVHFYRAVGAPMLEAYGATEVMQNVFNRIDDFKTGTAGKPVPGVELRLAEDGEILCRGPLNFSGYFKDPEKTAEVMLEGGWVATGDIGAIDEDGFLRIIDRKKEIIINSHGKNLSPAVIETAVLKETSLIAQFVAIGEARRYVVGLATLDAEAVQTFINQHPELEGSSAERVVKSDLIREEVEAAIARANKELNSNEQVKKFAIVGLAWEPGSQLGNEILTPTAKFKRRVVNSVYADVIDSLYKD